MKAGQEPGHLLLVATVIFTEELNQLPFFPGNGQQRVACDHDIGQEQGEGRKQKEQSPDEQEGAQVERVADMTVDALDDQLGPVFGLVQASEPAQRNKIVADADRHDHQAGDRDYATGQP